MAEVLSPTFGLDSGEVVEIEEKRKRRSKRSRRRASVKESWSDFGNEIWERVLLHLDGISLFSMLLLNKRFCNLVEHDYEAWKCAGLRCLPRAWVSLITSGSRITINSLEARLFLKYSLIHERTCFQALDAQDFSPYILRSSGVSVSALSRSLPEAHPIFSNARANADVNVASDQGQEAPVFFSSTPHSQTPSPALNASRSLTVLPDVLENATEDGQESRLNHNGSASMPELPLGPAALPLTLPSNQDLASVIDSIMSTQTPHTTPTTGDTTTEQDEDDESSDDDVAIADLATAKRHGTLHKSFSKLKQVVGMIHKGTKATTSPPVVTVKSRSAGTLILPKVSKKRNIKFDEYFPGSNGVDEAWFHLVEPNFKTANFARASTTRWRVMSEANLVVSVMSVYAFNPKVINVGAYMVRRMCFSATNPPSDEIASLRLRLANTPIVAVLLDALGNFRKDEATVHSILVALGNLALTNASACAIGDHGLGRVVRAMKRHKEASRVVDSGIILLLNVSDTRVEYKKKLRDLHVPQFLVKELTKFVQSLHQDTRAASDSATSGSLSLPSAAPDHPSPVKSSSKKSSSKLRRSSLDVAHTMKPVIRAHKQLQAGVQLPCYLHTGTPVSGFSSSPMPPSASESPATSTHLPAKSTAKDIPPRRPRGDSNRPVKARRNKNVEQIDMEEHSFSSSSASSSYASSSASVASSMSGVSKSLDASPSPAGNRLGMDLPVVSSPASEKIKRRRRGGSNGPAVDVRGLYNDNGFGEETQFQMEGFEDDDSDLDLDFGEPNDEAEVAAARRPKAMNKQDAKASAWTLRRRPPYSFLASQIAERAAEFTTMRRLIDLITVMGADYDILRQEVTSKCALLLGDAIVILFGCPMPHVDVLLSSAFRCLLVIYEWDVQNQDWSYSSHLVHSLLMLADSMISARLLLPYLSNCFLVIFSLVWKRLDENDERKMLTRLIIASLKMIAPSPGGEEPRKPTPFAVSGTLGTPSPAAITQACTTLVITTAAMLGDLAHSFYDLRSIVRDSGILQVLRSLRDEVDHKHSDRLNDILDEFEDNPLLRGRHRPQPQQDQDAGAQPQQQQQQQQQPQQPQQ